MSEQQSDKPDSEHLKCRTRGNYPSNDLTVSIGPTMCGDIADGLAFDFGSGGWVMDFADLKAIYEAAASKRGLPISSAALPDRGARTINAAGQEPLGESPGTALTGGYEQKDPRGSPVRDVPAPAAPAEGPTPRTDEKAFEAWDNPRGSAMPAMDVVYADFARQLERELAEATKQCPWRMAGLHECEAAWNKRNAALSAKTELPAGSFPYKMILKFDGFERVVEGVYPDPDYIAPASTVSATQERS